MSMTVAVVATAGGKLKPGDKVVVDYDFQPGPMGFHTYDLWSGLSGHLPWPPPSDVDASTHMSSSSRGGGGGGGVAADRLQLGPESDVRSKHRRHHRQRSGRPSQRAANDLGLGSPHSDLDWSPTPAGSFTEPLYFSIAINATIALLDMFATRGTPVRYVTVPFHAIRLPLVGK
jgi:hypothetical protein